MRCLRGLEPDLGGSKVDDIAVLQQLFVGDKHTVYFGAIC
jgi:hypothetical protein